MKKAGIVLLIGLLVLSFVMPASAADSDKIDLSKPVSLRVHYVDDEGGTETTLQNAKFYLYRVASVDEDGKIKAFSSDFAAFADTVTDIKKIDTLNAEKMGILACTLESKVKTGAVSETVSGITNTQGDVNFTGLESGWYLLTGDVCSKGGYRYFAAAALLHLPRFEEGTNTWEYNFTVKPKYEKLLVPMYRDITVKKIWVGTPEDQKKPVTVSLYQGTSIYDTIVLDENNHWEYTWEHKATTDDWFVMEKEEEGFSLSIQETGNTYLLTNTYLDDGSGSEESGSEKNSKTTTTTNNKTNPNSHQTTKTNHQNTTTTTNKKNGEKLPYTGMIWWPVPVLLMAGLALVITGKICKREQ